MAVIGRVVVFIILTLIAQVVTRQFYDWPDSSDVVVIKIVLCVIAAILLILAWRQYPKMTAYQTRAGMALNPARFSPEKLDCYVRFQGKLVAENAYTLPFSGKACAFYQSEVFAEWETKKKKPGTGMETQRKPLFRKQTPAELEIVAGEQRICVRAEDFTKSWLQLCKNEKTQSHCPAPIRDLADRKYETYKISENFACNGDTVTAQGRLTRHTDGRLFVKPTNLLKFPSFVTLRMQFAKEVAGKALGDARIKGIDMAAPVINALLLIYAFARLN